jgi:hypothetical protein
MDNAQLVRIGVITAVASLGFALLLIMATLAFDAGMPFRIALEGAALIALIFAVTELWSDLHGLRWRLITARVVDTAAPLERNVGETPAPHQPRIQTISVEYVVNGMTYRKQLNELMDPGTPVSVGRYPVDGELAIYYDPQAPHRSRLAPAPNYTGFGYLSFGIMLLGVALLSVVLV